MRLGVMKICNEELGKLQRIGCESFGKRGERSESRGSCGSRLTRGKMVGIRIEEMFGGLESKVAQKSSS